MKTAFKRRPEFGTSKLFAAAIAPLAAALTPQASSTSSQTMQELLQSASSFAVLTHKRLTFHQSLQKYLFLSIRSIYKFNTIVKKFTIFRIRETYFCYVLWYTSAITCKSEVCATYWVNTEILIYEPI